MAYMWRDIYRNKQKNIELIEGKGKEKLNNTNNIHKENDGENMNEKKSVSNGIEKSIKYIN